LKEVPIHAKTFVALGKWSAVIPAKHAAKRFGDVLRVRMAVMPAVIRKPGATRI
jgi:hypothetical protein